jgi:hypothetical protein
MNAALLDAGIVAGSLALFAVAYGLALLATRPASPRPAPATPELDDQPPAVVSLLGNRWRLTDDAAESTLLDLAARRIIELRQPANDPYHTTIHLRPDTDGADDAEGADLAVLNPYERRVLDRIRSLALGGVVPVTALTFRNQGQARAWNRRLHREVVKDARTRGLSRRRMGPVVMTVLSVVAALASAGFLVAALRLAGRDPDTSTADAFWLAGAAFVVLTGIAGRPIGERDTPAGREAASRWLGVRNWLRAHEEFAELPPAAVAVWDRYLPYGTALGVTHTASAVLDLGLGDRRLVWSSYGGSWRRVRVRYPKVWRRYGLPLPRSLARGALALAVGYALVRWHDLPAELGSAAGIGVDAAGGLDSASRVGLGFGVGLLAGGGYLLVRSLLDLATVRTITGEVLWVEKWRSRSGGRDRPRVPWLDYLAVDDGRSDRTKAWGLPRGTGAGTRAGDTVTIRVRPWSRRVVELTVVERARAVAEPEPPEEDPNLAGKMLDGVLGRSGAGGARRVEIDRLLTVDEVAQALGRAVRPPDTLPLPGFLTTAVFPTADRNRQVLMVQVASGVAGRLARRAGARATVLPGIGDAAHVEGDRAIVRVGETTVVLTLLREARDRRDQLPWLVERIAGRLPRGAEPASDQAEPSPA